MNTHVHPSTSWRWEEPVCSATDSERHLSGHRAGPGSEHAGRSSDCAGSGSDRAAWTAGVPATPSYLALQHPPKRQPDQHRSLTCQHSSRVFTQIKSSSKTSHYSLLCCDSLIYLFLFGGEHLRSEDGLVQAALVPHKQRASLQAAAVKFGAKGSLECEHSRLAKQGNEETIMTQTKQNQPTKQSLDCTFQLREADGQCQEEQKDQLSRILHPPSPGKHRTEAQRSKARGSEAHASIGQGKTGLLRTASAIATSHFQSRTQGGHMQESGANARRR